MSESEHERALAEALAAYHARRAKGESPSPEDFRDRLGDLYPEFVALLAAENAIDEAMAAPVATELPMTFGDYTLLRELGRGAAGVVYEAIHRPLGRTVAVKILRTGFDTDEKAVTRFDREGKACAQVRHDNLVPIYEKGQAEGRPYFSMALIPGESLQALVKAGRAPKGRDLYLGLAGIADGLQALHDAGIVHRDVKPSNIMVEPGGRMVLTDFGLARTDLAVTLTNTGDALGTPLYMSPEQMLGKRDEVDGRTDVYGLGATLYQALTGAPPFRTENFHELMRHVLSLRPRPAHEVAPDVPPEAERVAMKALEKRREDRYPSAAAMRADLLALAEGRAVTGRPVSRVRHFARERKAALVTAAVLVMVGLGAATWWTGRPASLRIVAVPSDSRVIVGAVVAQGTPFETALEPGTHVVRLEREHFEAFEKAYEVSAGDRLRLEELRLTPVGEEGHGILALETSGASYHEPERMRSAGEAPWMTLGWPRDAVRREDLSDFRVALGETYVMYEGLVAVEFRRRGAVLHRIEGWDPVSTDQRTPLPPEVLATLEPGDTVEWGVYPAERGMAPITARFHLVDPAPPELLQALATVDRTVPDATLRSELRAAVYLRHGLPTAAWREVARPLGRPDEVPDSVGRAAACVEALRRMGLAKTPFWTEATRRLWSFPQEAVRAYYEAMQRPGN